MESMRFQEEEIAKREDRLQRELTRLESKAEKEGQKEGNLQQDYERLRAARVDDALLIEKLRA